MSARRAPHLAGFAAAAVAAVLAALLAGGAAGAQPPPPAAGLPAWLAGCWQRTSGTRRIDEQWMAPAGGLMLGMSRTVDGERAVEYEAMQIRVEGGTLVFTAKPSGQPEAAFRSIETGPSRVVFENTAHDFPQRIGYVLGDGSQGGERGALLAFIEGPAKNGSTRRIEFPMTRVPCPGAR